MKKLKLIASSLFLIYVCMVVFVCFFNFSDTEMEIPPDIFGIPFDKIVHFIMFMPFPILLGLTMYYSNSKIKNDMFLLLFIVFAFGLCFAVATEIGQSSLTQYRSGDIFDVAADSLGLIFGTLIIGILKKPLKAIYEFIFGKPKTIN